MEAPERIWLDYTAANKAFAAYDEEPRYHGDAADIEYIRADLHTARIVELERERDSAQADVVVFSEMAAELIEEMSKNPGTTWGQVKAAVRALGDLGNRRAFHKREAKATARIAELERREACAVDLAREWEAHCKTAEARADALAALLKEAGEATIDVTARLVAAVSLLEKAG